MKTFGAIVGSERSPVLCPFDCDRNFNVARRIALNSQLGLGITHCQLGLLPLESLIYRLALINDGC
jgi:hypothetical protein